jgi:SAM-dependent methyltransferase
MKYYLDNAKSFFDGTVNIDMQMHYNQFLPLLPEGANIIDAGCGSGRDSKHFLALGYKVIAFDASSKLAKLATDLTQHNVSCTTFLEFNTKHNSQDGIWACASLLHIPSNELTTTFSHLAKFLKPKGVFYCSFKYGNNETERNGRHFTNLNEALLTNILKDSPLKIQQTWITSDLRIGRENEQWQHAILLKDYSSR